MAGQPVYGEQPTWGAGRPRFHVFRLLLAWALSALALLVAAAVVPGAVVHDYRGALVAAAAIGGLNAVLPPLVAALRLPVMALAGLLILLRSGERRGGEEWRSRGAPCHLKK